jgi:hypothetical protein
VGPADAEQPLALQAGVRHGFCLAGGYAVQEHGFVNRLSKDVDLLTAEASVVDFRRHRSVRIQGR